jgi:hypothetical protein
VDRFDENIANIVSGGLRKSGITFAPEAGTQRMRDIINKGLSNEELLRGVKTAFDQGWWQVNANPNPYPEFVSSSKFSTLHPDPVADPAQVKLYFMIGLPGETDADVLGIVETIKFLQSQCTRGSKHLAINCTISNFTPKPHTPFQWHTVSAGLPDRTLTGLPGPLRSVGPWLCAWPCVPRATPQVLTRALYQTGLAWASFSLHGLRFRSPV